MWQQRIEGVTAREIMETLNARGITWKDGQPWTIPRVAAATSSLTYAGYRHIFGNDYKRGTWEPIIDIETLHERLGDSIPWWVGYPEENERGRPQGRSRDLRR